MSETTNLNSELLSADARGRKHIPFAVFAVIVIHVVLFLFLLVAAGCRAKMRAKRDARPPAELAAQQLVVPAPSVVVPTNAAPRVASPPASPVLVPVASAPVVVTEPPVEKRNAPPAMKKAAQKSSPAPVSRPTAVNPPKAKVYVVKAGDTVEKIAKMHRTSVEAIKTENKLKDHLLKPGQTLRVGSQKASVSNEV